MMTGDIVLWVPWSMCTVVGGDLVVSSIAILLCISLCELSHWVSLFLPITEGREILCYILSKLTMGYNTPLSELENLFLLKQ